MADRARILGVMRCLLTTSRTNERHATEPLCLDHIFILERHLALAMPEPVLPLPIVRTDRPSTVVDSAPFAFPD